jgi:integrase
MTEQGRPFTANGFGNWLRDRCDEAGLPECSAHGLRKAIAAGLAEAGCSDEQIMAITGHTTAAQIRLYTQEAKQKVLAGAAMKALTRAEAGTKSANSMPKVSKTGT